MKQKKAKRRLALALALLACMSASMPSAASLAEENGDVLPMQQEGEQFTPEGEAEAPVPVDAPAAEESPEVEFSPEPVVTPQPSVSPEPEGALPPDDGATPEITPEPSISPDASPEAGITPEITPEPTPEVTKNPYEGWFGVTPSDERGMPIPILYQTDYPEVICTIRGIERSVESSGCGVVSISMVIAYLTGNTQQNPYSMFCDAVEKGLYTGEGFTHSMILHYANEYGVRGEWIGRDGDAIVTALEKGMPVIAHMGPGIFTDRGHYVVLRGVTEDGKILLNDPVSPYKTEKSFPLKTILTQSKTSNPFLVCWTEEMEEEYQSLKQPKAVEKTLESIAVELKRPVPSLPHAVEITTDLVNLRARPGKGDVRAALPMGARVWAVEERIMESGAFWYGVIFEGETLYLKGDYIQPVDAGEDEIAILQETALLPEAESQPEAETALPVETAEAIAEIEIDEPEPQETAAAAETPAPVVTPEPSAAFAPCAAEVIADRVNLRVSPGTGEVTKRLIQGAQVYVVEKRFTHSGAVWYGVVFEGETLYLKGEYIAFLDVDADELARIHAACLQPAPTATPGPTAEPAPQPTAVPAPANTPAPTADPLSATMDGEFDGAYIAYVSCDSANLRDHIGTNEYESLVICSVPHGTAMYIIDEELCYEDGYVWCKVLFRGRQLYVRGDLLQK